jgi:predicted amidohydrolase
MVRVAAIQLSSQRDLDRNLDDVEQAVRLAGGQGASLLLLPENFAYMGPEAGRRAVAESLDEPSGPVATRLGALSRELGLWLIAGGMPERSADPDRPYNSCAVWGPSGTLQARYRKIHLFDVDLDDGADYRESKVTTAGAEVVVTEAAGLRVGLSVCYDLRFPELYRRVAAAGAELIVVPAAFTLATGKDHWRVLLRARAIENQAYVLGAGQWGRHGDRVTYGRSCLIDPWGEIVAQASDGTGLVLGEVDLARLHAVRRQLPALGHRRLPV